MKYTPYLNVLSFIIVTLTLIINLAKMTPAQQMEAIKVTIESLDSLNKSFAVTLQKDTVITKDTVLIQKDSVKTDTVKLDSFGANSLK